MKKTKALLISYLAGYFDGEGCIFTRSEEGKRYENLSLGIDSRYDRKPLDLMASIFGGKVIIRWSNRDKKCFYHWQNQDAVRIRKALKSMLPFLRTKRAQAQEGIRLAERIIIGNKLRKKNKLKNLSEFERKKRQEIANKIRELKRLVPDELKRAETKWKNNFNNEVEAIVQTSKE